jgi:hypothetical protein
MSPLSPLFSGVGRRASACPGRMTPGVDR